LPKPFQCVVLALVFSGVLPISSHSLAIQDPQDSPGTQLAPRALANNDPAYVKLRHISISQEVIPVKDFVLQRDAGGFVFKHGVFHLLQPVHGKITGAVFVGEGVFSLMPHTPVEQKNLATLTHGTPFVESFSKAVFRFTDGTDTEISQAATPEVSSESDDGSSVFSSFSRQLRVELRDNLEARLLEDVLSSQPGGKFIAFIGGWSHKKLIYDVDPQGVVAYLPCSPRVTRSLTIEKDLEPEEVALYTWDYDHCGIWTAFHLSHEYANGAARSNQQNGPFSINHQKLSISVENDTNINGTAQTTITALRDGLRVLPLHLDEVLRVQAVHGENGQPLEFIQENIDEGADFAVVLPQELKRGDRYTITTEYKSATRYLDVIRTVNCAYYRPLVDDWYPTLARPHFATYEMAFDIPQGRHMAASGTLLADVDQGGRNFTQWRTDALQLRVDFAYVEFAALPKTLYGRSSVARKDRSGDLAAGQALLPKTNKAASGPFQERMAKKVQVGLELFRNYFGDEIYKKVGVTSGEGAAADLVVSSYDYSNRSGFQSRLSLDQVTGPESLAREWWGETVAFASYRDAWMEGFAETANSLFIEAISREHGLDAYHRFWARSRWPAAWRTFQPKEAVEMGPLTVAYRLPFRGWRERFETGIFSQRAIAQFRGAYVLQMIRFMLQDNSTAPDQPFADAADQFKETYGNGASSTEDFNAILRKHISIGPSDPEARFKALMHEYTQTYTSRIATTEDFKALVEKYMTPAMDIDGTHTMDWFFNEYVYGSAYPVYRFEHSFSRDPNGGTVLSFKLQQSQVDDSFVMLVPIYVESQDGRIVRVTSVRVRGNQTLEQQLSLKDLPGKPKRAWAAYFDDVLGDVQNK
jgi:hypothetical protein